MFGCSPFPPGYQFTTVRRMALPTSKALSCRGLLLTSASSHALKRSCLQVRRKAAIRPVWIIGGQWCCLRPVCPYLLYRVLCLGLQQVVPNRKICLKSSSALVGVLPDSRQLIRAIRITVVIFGTSMFCTRSTAFQIPVVVHANLDRTPSRATFFHRYPAAEEAVVQTENTGQYRCNCVRN